MYVSKLNFSGFCFSHEKVAYAMFVFEWTKSVNDPLTFLCLCVFQGLVYGRCLESETGLRGWKREGLQCCALLVQYCYAACRAVPLSPVSRQTELAKKLNLDVTICRNKIKVSTSVPSSSLFQNTHTADLIYACCMNAFTLVFPNTWCRISLARDKIFWLSHREGGVVRVWEQQQQFIWNDLRAWAVRAISET